MHGVPLLNPEFCSVLSASSLVGIAELRLR